MYRLTIDCGTSTDVFTFANFNDVRKQIKEYEGFYDDVVETLIELGYVQCGIDLITLEEVFDTYEISNGTLLKSKHDGELRVVKGLYVVKDGTTVIQNYEFYYNIYDKLKIKYRTGVGSSLEDIYINYDLVGEDFKLFTKEDK